MTRTPRLKVYRTPIGFHDAYVAAPSQKAALEAWGSDRDLFARGDAEIVVDAALTAEPLAAPGTVIRRSRGTAAEQVAALPPDRPKSQKARSTADDPAPPARNGGARMISAPPPRPRPGRDALDRAEQALSGAERAHAARLREVAGREAALARERRALERSGEAEVRRLRQVRDAAAAAYETAMKRWRG